MRKHILFLVFLTSSPVAWAQTTGGTGGATTGGGTSGTTTGGATAPRAGTGAQGVGGAGGQTGTFGSTNFAPTSQIQPGPVSAGQGGAAIPTTSNPFRTFYGNVYGMGVSSDGKMATNTKSAFGQPIFTNLAVAAVTVGGNPTGTNIGAASGFSTLGMIKAPAYVTALSEDVPLVHHAPAALQANLKDVLVRSTALQSKDSIQLQVAGDGAVRLSGTVASAREKKLVEGLVRLTPGVREVLNDLQIAAP